MGVPVTRFYPQWFRFDIEYASFEFTQICIAQITGALANLLLFLFLIATSRIMRETCRWFPKFWHKVICWIGIFAVADPYLTLFFDTVYRKWTTGDWFLFYHYFM